MPVSESRNKDAFCLSLITHAQTSSESPEGRLGERGRSCRFLSFSALPASCGHGGCGQRRVPPSLRSLLYAWVVISGRRARAAADVLRDGYGRQERGKRARWALHGFIDARRGQLLLPRRGIANVRTSYPLSEHQRRTHIRDSLCFRWNACIRRRRRRMEASVAGDAIAAASERRRPLEFSAALSNTHSLFP